MGAIQKKRALEHLYLSMWKSAYQTKEGARMKQLFRVTGDINDIALYVEEAKRFNLRVEVFDE